MLLVSLLASGALAAEIHSLGSAPLTPDPWASSPVVADDGTLWLTQPGGLISLSPDGWRWGWVRSAEIFAAGDPSVQTLDAEGALWVASDEGAVARRHEAGWERWEGSPWRDQGIRSLHPAPEGGIWVATTGEPGLWRLGTKGWEPAVQGPAPVDLEHGPRGTWLLATDGLVLLPTDQDGPEPAPPLPTQGLDLTVNPEGVWLASQAGLWLLPPDSRTWERRLEHSVRLISDDGGVWAAGSRALWLGGREGWLQIQVPTDAVIHQITHGPGDTTWVASRRWLLRWDGEDWTYAHSDDVGGPPLTMAHGQAHSWAVEPGTWRLFDDAGAIVQQVDLAWHPQPPTAPFHQLFVKDETAWGLGRELYRISTAMQKRQRFHDGPAEALALDRAGHPWLQLRDEIVYHDGMAWQPVPLPAQDASDAGTPRATAWPELLGSPAGQVLLLLGGVVHRWNDAAWEDLGRPLEQQWSPGPLLDRADGGLWLGTSRGLLLLNDSGAWQRQPVPIPGATTALLEARDGTLWIGTSAGLCARTPAGDYRVASRLAGRSVLSIFEQDDGKLLVDLEGTATLLLHPDDLRVSHTSHPQAHLRWRDPAGRVWVSTARSTRWSDGVTERTVAGPPSNTEQLQPAGGGLISGDPPITLAEGAAAWYRDGRWVGSMHPSPAPVGLVADAADDWTMLLADGTLRTLTPSGLLPHHAVAVGHATGLVRWDGTLCAAGSRGLSCRDEQGAWQPREGVRSVQQVAVQGRSLLLASQGQLLRLGRRGAPRPVASLAELPGAPTALVVDHDARPWVATDAGVLARLDPGGWTVVHRFDSPVRGLAATASSVVVRAGDELLEVRP
jgi:hypothetical protein